MEIITLFFAGIIIAIVALILIVIKLAIVIGIVMCAFWLLGVISNAIFGKSE